MESKYVEVLGKKMHYLEKGEGEVLLFVHGNPTSSYIWRKIIPKVSAYGRCIAIDLIGMGKSDKLEGNYGFKEHYKYFSEFIYKLGLKNVILVLHDWGSGLGFHYYKENSENVKGIVFMEAIVRTHENYEALGESEGFFRELRDPDLGRKKVIDENFFIEAVIPGGTIRKLSKEEHDFYREPYLKKEDREVLLAWPREVSIDGEPEDMTKIIREYMESLEEFKIPKLLLYAEPGAVIKEEDRGFLEDKLENFEVKCVGKGIHFIQEDEAENIAEEIVKWVKCKDLI